MKDHPNIIKLYETFEDSKNIYLIMELCQGGELFDRISAKGNFSEKEARHAFTQIISAINYCHLRKIAHRHFFEEKKIYFLINLFKKRLETRKFSISNFGRRFPFESY